MVNKETLQAKQGRPISAALDTDKLKKTLNDRGARGDAVTVVGNSNVKRNIMLAASGLVIASVLLFNFKMAGADINPAGVKTTDAISSAVLSAAGTHEFNMQVIGALEKERRRITVDAAAQVRRMFPFTDYAVKYSAPVGGAAKGAGVPKGGNEIELLLVDIENKWRGTYEETVHRNAHRDFEYYRKVIIANLKHDINQIYNDKKQPLWSKLGSCATARVTLDNDDTNGSSMNG